MLKVCIFGGGAIGGHIAGHLARDGQCEVTVVARGNTLEAIKKDGLKVITPTEEFTVRVNVSEDPKDFGVQDYIFLTMKAHQVDEALEQITPLMDEHTVVLPPTTGIPYYFFHNWEGELDNRQLKRIDRDGRQWQHLPPCQVLGCVYWIGAHSVEPGVVAQDGAKAGCPIGELDGSHSKRVTQLSELLVSSGINCRVNDNIRAAIWVKFVNSLCWNPVAVLTLATLAEINDAGDVVPFVLKMMEEADSVATSLGLDIPQPPEKRIAMTLNAGGHKMSMLQDLEQGRPLELEVLEQSIKAVSEISRVPTPTLDMVLALAKLRASAIGKH
ncbi:ketopantoate reductase family protein [Vreelandella titanicae]|uniref:ketopantoate reductase family protein n=1 Tax=Vreelandella titanicae TaxID=664683 RepID=UPI0003482430|nr:2-dehydropantoate 2-reductase [Halomonas titanicae]